MENTITPELVKLAGKQIFDSYVASLSIKERIRGIGPEDLLKQFDPEELLRGLDPEIRLKGLDPEIRLKGLDPKDIRAWLDKIEPSDKPV